MSLNKILLQVREKGKDHIFLSPWLIILICAIALAVSAYCSGANFAYMRMSINDMALVAETGEEPHKTHARKIIKYRKQSNWLICTMAVTNILANTIFTNCIGLLVESHRYGEVLAYVVPTVMIVLLGEMLPQSVCNRFGLMLAAKTRHFTLFLFIVCAPVAWPLSKLIDFFLGREVREIYSEEKLKILIKVQAKKMEEAAQDILARIADFPKKTVEDMMTPVADAFVVSGNDRLDVKLLVTILEKGFTRIPVFEEKNRLNLTAVLNVKDDSDKMWNNRRAGIHKDQQTLDWFRTSETERSSGLGVNATLRLIQSIFDSCPLLVTLGYDVLRMKGLLSDDKVRHVEEDEVLTVKSGTKMLIFFSGTITVKNGRTTTYRLDANRADFRPYIIGRSIVKRIFKERLRSLSCLKGSYEIKTIMKSPIIRAITRATYFEITPSNILNGLRDLDDVGVEFNMLLATPPSESIELSSKAMLASKEIGLDSTQESTPDVRKMLRTTPKHATDGIFHSALTPQRLRSSLQKLRSSPYGSAEYSRNSGSEGKLVKKNPSWQQSPATAREARIRSGPPSKEHPNQLSKNVPTKHKSPDKDREVLKARVKASTSGRRKRSKKVKKDSEKIPLSKEKSDLVVVPSATNLHLLDQAKTAAPRTPRKRSSLLSYFKRKNQ
ncbi:hypothetical protein GCK32_003300 [Trichostrongylus colubriformis]|uniref:CNNM transmembrane domain-containing protein n=1 Tax=Trichostrongylus colubriformis TaxID=6319 RepID=A0AAN8IR23_TRICO